MFTGLIQAVGVVVNVREDGAPRRPGRARGGGDKALVKSKRLTIDLGAWGYAPALGDSIAVDGCCLTVAAVAGDGTRRSGVRRCEFVAVPETLSKTTLGTWRAGDRVNLEHAARAETLLGGHIVQGHVDGLGVVERVQKAGDWRVRVSVSESLDQYLAPKGSVCVNGVSLTVAALWNDGRSRGFEVALIPTTLELTTLCELKAGDRVNVEMDILAKTVVRVVQGYLEKNGSLRQGAKRGGRGTGNAPTRKNLKRAK